jgi:PAS domain S-box-containing protein
MKFLDSFFLSIDFMPHGYCYLWKPGLIWLHAVSDSLIALAYFSIPVTLIYFIRKRRDLPFNWMFVSFGMFILACGATHIMEVWTLWHGTYWLSGAIKAVTAIASVPTAILLVHLVPRALALPSAEAMKLEIAERERAQEALHRTKDELELRVLERTAELRRANEELVAEIAQRRQAEDALRERERLIHAILDNSPALIFLKDREGRYLLINKEFEETFGVTQEEIRGKKDEQVFPAEHATAFRANDLRVLQTGVPAEFEEVALQDDGPHTSFVHKFPLLDAAGKIYAIGGIATDITERKRAEKESVALKDELATELVAMARLHEFSTRLLSKAELTELLEEALRATIVLQNADFGNVQLYNPDTKTLEIVAHRGFQQNFLDYFSSVSETGAACGRSLQQRDRVIIEDVLADPDFEPHRQIAASAGFRAVQSTPLFSRTGEPLGMISTHFRQPHRPSERELRFTDLYARLVAELMERQRAEAALRASEERFRHMVEGIKDYAIYMLDLDGRVIAWNVGAERMKNYSSQEILGRHFSRFYEPRDVELGKPERALKEAAVAGRFEDEGWRVRKDGSRFWANVITTAMKDEAGKLQGFVKVTQDMTERKRAEEALRENEERFRSYFELGLIGMAMTSPTKGILEVNDELCSILGYERSELLKKSWAEMTNLDDLAADVAQFNRVLAGETDGYTLDKKCIRKDGRVIDTIMSAKCLRRADGSVDYFVGLVQDITERKRSEEALRAAQAELAHMARVSTMGELAASIAHEVNQPLTAIVANGDAGMRWLSQVPPNTDEARNAMKEMVVQGHRASDVIGRIRGLIRKAPPNLSTFGANQLIEDVLVLTRQQVAEHGITVRVELAAGIPSISGDPVQLQQVLVNLILNAIEATSVKKDGAREVVLTSQRQGINEIVIAVHDSGKGVAPQDMDQLFRPFFTTKAAGIGMGLAISRSIIEAQGGRLWATSNEGIGATFQFSLPALSVA